MWTRFLKFFENIVKGSVLILGELGATKEFLSKKWDDQNGILEKSLCGK